MSARWMNDDGVTGDSVHRPDACCTEPDTFCVPVVVIDPEDREQVKRLADLVTQSLTEHDTYEPVIAAVGGALREFADPKPPKPAEPTGLGAVVETVDEVRVIRVSTKVLNPWQVETTGSMWSWHEVDAVRVLSEGVQS